MSKRPFSPRENRKTSGKDRLPGVRATERAVQNGLCRAVYVAKDAEERVVKNLLRLCEEKGIPVSFFDSMKELGEFCSLKVGASACAILKEPGDGTGK
ncbi:MAG: 50S ribosomal protein L7Ae-like protein [Firmicutes bacterium]|jgi:large subunit ribosomal protein L7A|nr:50S ribosomal protein L7Ae-like protein [Candidatus Fermentithermobacillaceae bacterium]